MKGIVNSLFTFIRWFYIGYLFSALLVVFLHKYATLNVNWLGSTAKQIFYVIIDIIIFLLEVNMDNFHFFGLQYQYIVTSNVSTTKLIEQKNTKEKSELIRPRKFTSPPGIEPPEPLNQRQTCYHLSQCGELTETSRP